MGYRLYTYATLFLLASLVPAGLCWSQDTIELVRARSQNHISENACWSLLKDTMGYVWVGTIDGLNRYDGYQFRIYQHDPLDPGSLSGNFIRELLQDRTGTLWVGTSSGLNRYSRAGDCFTRYYPDPEDPHALPGMSITDLLEDGEGRLWVATYDGLSRWDPMREQFINLPIDPTGRRSDALRMRSVKALAEAPNGDLWIGCNDGTLSRLRAGRLKHVQLTEGGAQAPPVADIRDLLALDDGRLLVAAVKGLYLFDPERAESRPVAPISVRKFARLSPGRIIANAVFDGVYEWKAKEERMEKLVIHHEGERIDGDIRLYLQDERQIIWGTYRGLVKQDPYERRFRHIGSEKSNRDGLSEGIIVGIAGDGRGNLWAATQNRGLNYFDAAAGRWRNYRNDEGLDNELSSTILNFNCYRDGDYLWLNSGRSIFRYHTRSHQVDSFAHPQGSLFPQSGNFLRDSRGKLWFGTKNQLLSFDADAQRWQARPLPIKILHEDGRDGRLWGLSDETIYRYDAAGDRFLPEARLPQLVVTDYRDVDCVQADGQGNLWIGTNAGLIKYDPAGQSFESFTVADGLPNHTVVSLLFDERDHLWLATNRGLATFHPATRRFRCFDTSDGLQGEIFLPRAAWKGPDGRMYFGGVNGINVFHPDELRTENPHPPPVRITALKLFNEPVRPGPGSVLSKPISETERLQLSYRHRLVSFELLAFGYTQSTKNRYAYMIEGVDKDWNYTGTGRTASYIDLPRGRELLFKAKAANHDGIWTESPTLLRIYITPPFWETRWFRGLTAAALLLAFLGLYRYRLRTIRQRNQWLEEQVRQQTAEIQQQAKTIREKADQLDQLNQAQSKFFTGLTHEFRTPLTLLMGHVEALTSSLSDEAHLQNAVQQIHYNADRLSLLVNQLMDVARLESGRYPLRVHSCDLGASLHNIVSAFQLPARQKGLELTLVTSDDLPRPGWLDTDILQKLLYNLIGNAVKYTETGGVRVEATRAADGRLLIAVRDTGPGIPPGQVPFLFDRFYRLEDTGRRRQPGSGVGLSLVKQLTELHKGAIEVESAPGKGSTFYLRLPVAEADYQPWEKGDAVQEEGVYPEQGAPVPVVPATGSPEANQGATVLIVEDHPEINAFLAAQLGGEFRILTAADGHAGWEQVLSEQPDVVISDVLMPGMDGFALCRRIKEDLRTSHLPVILLTALSEQEKRLEGWRTGADSYVNKPFHTQELRLRLRNLLAHQERLRRQFEQNLQPGYLPPRLSDPDQELLEKLNAYIQERLSDEHLQTEAIGKALGISRSHLFRKLKTLTGMSLTEYLRDYRLRIAYQMLLQQSSTITEVIYATGFSSRSYFYRCFKKKFGMLPGEVAAMNAAPPPKGNP